MKKMFALGWLELYCAARRSEFVIYYLMLMGLSVLAVHIMGGAFQPVRFPENISKVNSPGVIDVFANTVLLIAIFMIAGIAGNGAIRDYRYKSYELIQTFPLNRVQYIVGKFTGLYLACLLLFTAPLAGYALACLSPWVNPEFFLPFSFDLYACIYLQRYVISVFFLSAVFFTAGLLTTGKTINRILLVLWYSWFFFSYCWHNVTQ